MIFPNPSNGSEINIKLIGKTITAANYIITDLTGRIVQEGIPFMPSNELMQVKLNHQILNGNYFIKVSAELHKEIVFQKK